MRTCLYIYAQDGIKNFLDTLSKIEQDVKSGHFPIIAETQLVFDSIRLSDYDSVGRPLVRVTPSDTDRHALIDLATHAVTNWNAKMAYIAQDDTPDPVRITRVVPEGQNVSYTTWFVLPEDVDENIITDACMYKGGCFKFVLLPPKEVLPVQNANVDWNVFLHGGIEDNSSVLAHLDGLVELPRSFLREQLTVMQRAYKEINSDYLETTNKQLRDILGQNINLEAFPGNVEAKIYYHLNKIFLRSQFQIVLTNEDSDVQEPFRLNSNGVYAKAIEKIEIFAYKASNQTNSDQTSQPLSRPVVNAVSEFSPGG